MILSSSFYSRNTKDVAIDLLGKILVHKTPAGAVKSKIVETEAYFGEGDPGSHAYRGKTARNYLMYGPVGRAYVYFCYGNHWLFNIVAKKGDSPGAVLIRAVEPLEGMDIMKRNRGMDNPVSLTSGPGKLTQAMGIGKAQNGADLTKGALFVANSKEKPAFSRSGRVGIANGAERLLRFYVKGNPFVSKY
jgi:DNA-3-methyladenine glycosylase